MMKRRSLKIFTATILMLVMLLPYAQSMASSLNNFDLIPLGDPGDTKIISTTSYEGGNEKTGTVPPGNSIYDISGYYRYITTVTGITPPSGAGSGEIYIRNLKGHATSDVHASFYCLDPTKLFPPEPDGTLYTSIGSLSQITDAQLSAVLNKNVTVAELQSLIQKFYLVENYGVAPQNTFFENEYKELLVNSLVDGYNSRDKIYQYLTDDDIKVAQQWALWNATSDASWGASPIIKRDLNQTGDDETPIGESGYRSDRNAMLINLAGKYGTSELEPIPQNNTNLVTDLTHIEFEDGGQDYIDFGTFRINTDYPELLFDIRLLDYDDVDITTSTNYSIFIGDVDALGTNYGIPIVGNLEDNRNNPDLLNHNFFLRFDNPSEIDGIKLELGFYTRRFADAEIFEANDSNYQNVIKIETYVGSQFILAGYTKPEILSDLALRKFITHINGIEVDSREPVVTEINEAINKGSQTTAHYAHIKKPLIVKPGDTVTYKMRVYNESTKNDLLYSIMDILPEGLSLKTGPGINEDWEVLEELGDGRTVLLFEPSSPHQINAAELDGEGNYQMDSYDITVDILVDEEAPTGLELTNIAFINRQRDQDIDSQPGLISKDGQNDISDIRNVDLPGYRGYDNDSQTLDQPTWYYRGYEDDDDFEKVILKPFDLALRKFIIDINGEVYDREPIVDVTHLADGTNTTATYTHPKNSILVEQGDVVTYKIRVYNEGGLEGYVRQIKDHLPTGLGYIINHKTNLLNEWEQLGSKAQLTNEEKLEMPFLTNIPLEDIALEIEGDPGEYSLTENAASVMDIHIVKGEVEIITEIMESQIIPAFNPALGEEGLSYVDVEVVSVVLDEIEGSNLRNWAEISEHADEDGNPIRDRDSTPDNWIEHPTGPYEDDEDYEDLTTTFFDLALRKFITSINDDGNPNTSGDVVDREPVIDVSPLVNETGTTAIYSHPKTPVTVQKGDLVTYTIRVYNEGMMDGHVTEIIDHIPKGLAFLPQHTKNIDNGWELLEGGTDAIVSDYPEIDFKLREDDLEEVTSLENTLLAVDSPILRTTIHENTLIPAFDGDELSYVDVEIVLVVLEDREHDNEDNYIGNLRNWAEIGDDSNEHGNDVIDRDSTPNNWRDHQEGPYEDDEDYEDLTTITMVFDLALQKFITEIISTAEARNQSPTDLADRRPVINIDSNNKIIYTKANTEPPLVGVDDTVIYTIRVYNEGDISGYAKRVRDTLPAGLTYLDDHEINLKYQWYFIDEDGNEVADIEDATYIETAYLSRDAAIEREGNNEEPDRANTILNAFNKDTQVVSYRDIEIAFKVNEKATPGANNLRNIAEISDDEDEDGNEVDDIDSTPGNNVPGEDDIDEEDLKVTYFDLALLKIVTNVELTENGKTKNIPTGHTFDMIPEPIVKTDLDERYLDKTQIKYTYKIRVFNEGLVEGYATKVADYIPEGLEFHAEDQKNNKWTQIEKGLVETTDLADVLLKPGEYTTVEIVLRWINHRNNMGVKTNVAEISEDHNEYDLPDIDSIPGNRKPGEDDIDDASVLVAIRTGAAETFFTVSLTMALIVGLGTVLIRKYIV